jgi:hypothetical protein
MIAQRLSSVKSISAILVKKAKGLLLVIYDNKIYTIFILNNHGVLNEEAAVRGSSSSWGVP